MSTAATAAALKLGESGTVADVVGVDEIATRLMEMGVTPGATLTLIGTAPLGDPLEFEIRGYHLSVRRTEAERIQLD